MSYCFVHAADLHLDAPFSGTTCISDEGIHQLCNASLKAFDALVELTIEREASFLVLAGDTYDGLKRGVRAQIHIRKCLELLQEKNIPVYMVLGDEDPHLTAPDWPALVSLPANLIRFGMDEVECVPVERDGSLIANLYGISCNHPKVDKKLIKAFQRSSAAGVHIGVLHGAIDEAVGNALCSLGDLEKTGLDYWALGHVHQHRILKAGHPWIVYPGTPQGRNPFIDGMDPKGAVVVEVGDGGIEKVNLTPLEQVRPVMIELDISSIPDIKSLQKELTHRGELLHEQNQGVGLLVHTLLVGQGAVCSALQVTKERNGLLEALRKEFERYTPILWWEPFRNKSRWSSDLDAIRERDDFSSALVSLNERLAEDWDELNRIFEEAFQPMASALGDRMPRSLGAERKMDENLALLAEAEARALDLLEGRAVS
jgi:DNA repair exonuclease SbcCD nuclease subunit